MSHGKAATRRSSIIRDRSSMGFTLIELLVVVAIIAVLISILVPSLQQARRLAQMVQCLAGMRGLGLAAVTYASEQQGYWPPPADFSSDQTTWSVSPYWGRINLTSPNPPLFYTSSVERTTRWSCWADKLAPYVNAGARAFSCPAIRHCEFGPPHSLQRKLTDYTHFGMNRWLSREWGWRWHPAESKDNHRVSGCRRPGAKVLMAETTCPSVPCFVNDWETWQTSGFRLPGYTFGSNETHDPFRHGEPRGTSWDGYLGSKGLGNYVFADGHGESLDGWTNGIGQGSTDYAHFWYPWD